MAGLFDNFNNINTSYMPNQYQPKYPSTCNSNSQLLETCTNKPFELKNFDGSLKGYFWYRGNSVELCFNLEGEITLLDFDKYITIADILNELTFEATFYDNKYNKIISFDNFPNSKYPIKSKINVTEKGLLENAVIIIDLSKEVSDTYFQKGIYHLDLIASHPSGYCETLFSTGTCIFEVK